MPTRALPDFVEPLGSGVYCIDTGFTRPRFDAAYLLVDQGRAAFIDTGTNFAVPRLLAALQALALPRDVVDYVIPTHVHLDHAGGVGRLMRELPRARALVHPRGLRHMIDPSALYQGALSVYGAAAMAREYGELLGVDAARAEATHDGMTLRLGARTLRFADTPGHARHHHCIWDEASAGWFTGDTFGLSYREFDTASGAWLIPSSTPVQFEHDVLRVSIARLLEPKPQAMYLTHYGRVGDVQRLASEFLPLLQGMVDIGLAHRHAADRHARLREGLFAMYLRSVRAHGCRLSDGECASLLEMDLELNAQGMAAWLDRS
ncbi:MAG: MBL fold metallo-hydrolase [Burkholderiaceae bacterium]|jgi:glyoxylase-like metal-dependent hydrolase (beta-lactamase superfamily II)|nr:MBL fold metallo-hydrolase [Burkholderiaceae bacterium]